MASLFSKYRPRTWEELIGHDHIQRAIRHKAARGELGGSAYMFTGPSGCGKTSLAYLLAGELCDPDNFVELDAGDATPSRVEELERSQRFRCLGDKVGRAVLINECHGLRKDTIRKLLVVLERIPRHACWIFTTTNAGQQMLFDGIDAGPLCSRCVSFNLDGTRYLRQFAQRVKQIAELEGLGGANVHEYVELAKRCKGNFRQMLCEVEAGLMWRGEPVLA